MRCNRAMLWGWTCSFQTQAELWTVHNLRDLNLHLQCKRKRSNVCFGGLSPMRCVVLVLTARSAGNNQAIVKDRPEAGLEEVHAACARAWPAVPCVACFGNISCGINDLFFFFFCFFSFELLRAFFSFSSSFNMIWLFWFYPGVSYSLHSAWGQQNTFSTLVFPPLLHPRPLQVITNFWLGWLKDCRKFSHSK